MVLSFSSVSVINFVVVHNLVNSLIVILVTIATLLLISVAHVSCVYYTTLPQVPNNFVLSPKISQLNFFHFLEVKLSIATSTTIYAAWLVPNPPLRTGGAACSVNILLLCII